MSPSTLVLLAGCAAAAFYDVRERRIPNWLCGAIASSGLVLAASEGTLHVLQALLAGAAILTIGTFVYARGWFGGGDVKLAAAASVLVGYPDLLVFLLYGMLSGGVLSALLFAARKRFGGAYDGSVPYALAFAFGATIVALSQTVAPFLRLAV